MKWVLCISHQQCVNTFLPFSFESIVLNTSDVWVLWHMWSTISFIHLSSFISLHCVLTLLFVVLFIVGPSEPHSLLIILTAIAYILSNSSAPFQLTAEKKVEWNRCGTNLCRACVCSPLWEAAKVSSCVGLKSLSKLLSSSSAAVRTGAWCCYREAECAEGEGSGAECTIPQAASNVFAL